MAAKQKWEKLARSTRLVRTEILGTVTKTTKGANWKRADGAKGKATSERAAKKVVEAASPPQPKLTKAQLRAAAKAATVPVSRPHPSVLPITAETLYAEAKKVPESGRFRSLVFLAPLLERFGTTPQEAKAKLLQLHREAEITLTRADLVEAMDPEMVRRSEISVGGARLHFLAPVGY